MASGPYNVVLLPGFGGSTLSYRGGSGGKTKYWYNPRVMVGNNPLAAALADDGTSPYPVLGKTLFADGPVDTGTYEPMLTALANAGYNPVFWAYDWRLDQGFLASQLAIYLATAKLTNPFQVVAHSNGGLVAQLAYPSFQALSPTNTWKQTVYVGTPHGGSYWSSAALAGWFPHGSDLALWARLFEIPIPLAPGINVNVVTALHALVATVFGSWPGLYGLLPNYFGVWQPLDSFAAQLAQVASYAGFWPGQQAARFSAAIGLMQLLAANLTKPRAVETCVYCDDFDTLAEYNGTPNNPSQVSSYSKSNGDGTVPTNRAVLPAIGHSSEVQKTRHIQMMNTNPGINAVLAALAAPPPSNDTFPFVPPATPHTTYDPGIDFRPAVQIPFANIHADP